MIQPLATFFEDMPWPPTMEWFRVHQMGVTVMASGILIMVKDWESRPHNSLTWAERKSLYGDMLLAQDFVSSLGADLKEEHVQAIKMLFPNRRIYWAATDKEIL